MISEVGASFSSQDMHLVLLTPKKLGSFSLNQICVIKFELDTLFVFRELILDHIHTIGKRTLIPDLHQIILESISSAYDRNSKMNQNHLISNKIG